MRKLVQALAIATCIQTTATAEDTNAIFKIGHQSVEYPLGLGVDLDMSGFSITGEFPMQANDGGMMSAFVRYGELSNDDDMILGTNVDADVDTIGVGIKYNFIGGLESGATTEDAIEAMSEKPSIFARIGFEKSDGSGSYTIPGGITQSLSDDDTGLVFGVGAEYYFEDFGVFAEWNQHDNDIIDDSSITFGVTFKF